jgi:hypothetical protein
MKSAMLVAFACVVAVAMVHMGCMDREPAPVCPVPTELNQTEALIGGFEGVDMLVVVDNSGSMQEEQEILATAFFPLVNALVNPLPGWPYAPADNVRVAIVSSDMGLQWGNNPYENGDGWPGDTPQGCGSVGDNGEFQTYSSGKTINIQNNTIPCGENAAQCPTGWNCENIDDNIGECVDPVGDGTNQTCPGMAAIWAETPIGSADDPVPNEELAFQVACLSALGTGGCGFEQQLQASAVALNKSSQADFVRDDALLAVIVVSDEEDCSIESNGLFAENEIQNLSDNKVNIACGSHPEHLFEAADYKTTFEAVKGGKAGSAVFAAIVGVPAGSGDELSACEGSGDVLSACLDHPDMELEVIQEGDAFFFEPACDRYDGDVQVTKARPGRRYVEVAQEFQNMGYMYSICRPNWSPAMEDIAQLIAENLAGTCYPKPLDWDPARKKAKCDVVVQYDDVEDCPFDIAEGKEVIEEEWVDGEDVEHTRIFCPLPQLEAERDCSTDQDVDLADDFGWYYCENMSAENFNEACDDSLDNDGDGLMNCDDPDCKVCTICDGSGVGCAKTCKYVVQLTESAKLAVQGQGISVQCLQQFSFSDPNCQENTNESCNNNEDEDGNGIWDCEDDFEADKPHQADFNCCPMEVDEDNNCVVKSHDNCNGSSDDDPSDACRAHASLLQCIPPWD